MVNKAWSNLKCQIISSYSNINSLCTHIKLVIICALYGTKKRFKNKLPQLWCNATVESFLWLLHCIVPSPKLTSTKQKRKQLFSGSSYGKNTSDHGITTSHWSHHSPKFQWIDFQDVSPKPKWKSIERWLAWLSGCWLTYSSEKYDFVNWDVKFPISMEKYRSHVLVTT